MNKNSETLMNDLKNFLTFYLGFGDFIFRNSEGNQMAVAHSLREFEALAGAGHPMRLFTFMQQRISFHSG